MKDMDVAHIWLCPVTMCPPIYLADVFYAQEKGVLRWVPSAHGIQGSVRERGKGKAKAERGSEGE